jgi:hypothetical protein
VGANPRSSSHRQKGASRMTVTSETALRAEADALQAKRPDAIKQPQGVSASTSIWATDAQVRTEVVCQGSYLVVRLSRDGLAAEQLVFLDAATSFRLFRELDDAISVCDGCNRPGFSDDLDHCAVTGGHLHADCHRSLFSGSATHQREGCFK